MNSDLITLIANLALTLSFVVAVIFGIAQVNAAAHDRRERLTLETLRNFQTREFAQLMFYVSNNSMPLNQQQYKALPDDEQVSLIEFAQQMESLGILVAQKFINIDLVDITLGSLVTTSWEKYKPMFLEIREKTPDPFLGEYFQWLAEQIDERMKENPRKPFFQTGAVVSKK